MGRGCTSIYHTNPFKDAGLSTNYSSYLPQTFEYDIIGHNVLFIKEKTKIFYF